MTTYFITDQNSWNSTSSSVSDGDNICLMADITFTTQPSVILIQPNTTFNGLGRTLTHQNVTTPQGLFNLQGGLLQNLTVNGNGQIMTSLHGLFLNSTSNQYGTIRNCQATNGTPGQNGGGIVGYNFGHASNPSLIQYCDSDVTLASRTGAIAGTFIKNTTIDHSYVHSPDVTSSNGTFIGGFYSYSSGDINITHCHSSINISGGGTQGGFIGTAVSGTITIEESYQTGQVGNGAGGFLGRTESGSNVTIVITNCYSAGAIAGTNAFGAGSVINTLYSPSSITLTNYYQGGVVSGTWGSGLVVNNQGSFMVTNTYLNTSVLRIYGTTPSGSPTTSTSSLETTLPAGWSPTIWDLSDQLPLLRTFQNTEIWNGYTSYDSNPTLNSSLGKGGGDPHIKTIYGEVYIVPNNLRVFTLFEGKAKEGKHYKIVAHARFLRHEEVEKLHYLDRAGWIQKIKIDKNHYTQNLTYIDEISFFCLHQSPEPVLVINAFTNDILKHNIDGDLEIRELFPLTGLYSLTHSKHYPLTKSTKEIEVSNPENTFHFTLKTDQFWDDINDLSFQITKNEFDTIQGGLINRLAPIIEINKH